MADLPSIPEWEEAPPTEELYRDRAVEEFLTRRWYESEAAA